MDFTNTDQFVSSMGNNFTNEDSLSTTQKNISQEVKLSNHILNKLELAKSNIDLVNTIVKSKDQSFLSESELINYGIIAINTAAIDALNDDSFRSFAKERIERMLDRAIAEARLIAEHKGDICASNELIFGFESIQQNHCYS